MKKLSEKEAWDDFYTWIKQDGRWEALGRAERNRLITADRDSRGERSNPNRGGRPYHLGFARLRSILTKHAPGRYRFEVVENIYLEQ